MTRRHLLGGLAAGLVGAAATAPAIAAPLSRRRAAADLERGGIADWSGEVGALFAVAGGGTLRLTAVEPLCSGGPTPSRATCFAAHFEAVAGPVPEGGATHALAPRSGPAMPLFLGARASVGGRERLVAVFN
jgi:hypothetical protein